MTLKMTASALNRLVEDAHHNIRSESSRAFMYVATLILLQILIEMRESRGAIIE